MKKFRFAIIAILAVAMCAVVWRVIRARKSTLSTSAQTLSSGPANRPQQSANPQPASAATPPDESTKRLGPFSIAARNYSVDLQTKKLRPGAATDAGDTVVGMEIRDDVGTMLFRKAFPYVEATDDYLEFWSVSALILSGKNGMGLLVSYDSYSEPSAPEEEPSSWLQIFGVVDGKLAPFGAPFLVQGGLLEEYLHDNVYKAAQPLGAQADEVEFKVWTGHARMRYPVRVDWAQGKLTPAQDCTSASGSLSAGCQYKVLPEEKLYRSEVTFVRLWPGADEKSGPPIKTIVKNDSKVELVTALAAAQWVEGNLASPSASKSPLDDAGGVTIAPNSELWLKVRIDGKEGWMHTEEDFRALGLPEDE